MMSFPADKVSLITFLHPVSQSVNPTLKEILFSIPRIDTKDKVDINVLKSFLLGPILHLTQFTSLRIYYFLSYEGK